MSAITFNADQKGPFALREKNRSAPNTFKGAEPESALHLAPLSARVQTAPSIFAGPDFAALDFAEVGPCREPEDFSCSFPFFPTLLG